jgi:hypothetical protein
MLVHTLITDFLVSIKLVSERVDVLNVVLFRLVRNGVNHVTVVNSSGVVLQMSLVSKLRLVSIAHCDLLIIVLFSGHISLVSNGNFYLQLAWLIRLEESLLSTNWVVQLSIVNVILLRWVLGERWGVFGLEISFMFWEPTDSCVSFHGPLWSIVFLLISLVCTGQTWKVIISWSYWVHVSRKCFHQFFLSCSSRLLVSTLLMFACFG